MIVITSICRTPRVVEPGDRFRLSVRDDQGEIICIEEEITENKVIDFVASYRFALDDGTCLGFHLSGFFGNSAELPLEIQQAVRVDDLTPAQRERFLATVGTRCATKEAA